MLQKSWTIASSCQSLAKLQQYKCKKDHQHGQSRGAALKRAESYTYEMTDLIHGCFSEFADSMKQVVTDSSAQRPTKRALVALKLPSPVAAMAAYNLGEYSEGNLEYLEGALWFLFLVPLFFLAFREKPEKKWFLWLSWVSVGASQ